MRLCGEVSRCQCASARTLPPIGVDSKHNQLLSLLAVPNMCMREVMSETMDHISCWCQVGGVD